MGSNEYPISNTQYPTDEGKSKQDLTGLDRICRIRKCSFIPQAREHEVKKLTPGNAALRSGIVLK